MLPSLFLKESIKSFHCDDSKFAKHHVIFPPICNEPFAVIHSDVLGATSIPNISSIKWFVSFIDDCTKVIWYRLMKDKSEAFQLLV